MLKWNDVLKFAKNGNPIPPRKDVRSDEDWRKVLTSDEFQVIRKKGTERAFSGEYCEMHEPGLYACRACGTELFDSGLKFESGTGWPSFTQPVAENAIAYHQDTAYGMVRVEVICNVCGGHLGHVFPDGPAPSGLRYCINSASIRLVDSK